MLATFGRIGAILVVSALSAIGFLTLSTSALVAWVILASLAGVATGLGVRTWRTRGEHGLRQAGGVFGPGLARLGAGTLGTCVFGATLIVALSLTGLVAAVGAAVATGAAVVVLGAVAWWLWPRGEPLATASVTPGGGAPPVTPTAEVRRELVATTLSIKLELTSTPDLCVIWRRSYWLLLDLPPGTTRDQLVDVRQCLLDELERRAPNGFRRWLRTGARAGGDPSPYLVNET